MKSTDVFRSYDFDEWQEGHNIKLEHTVYYSNDGTALLPLIKSSPKELRELRKVCVSQEHKAFIRAQDQLSDWEKKAAMTMLIDRALEYLKMPKAEHTSNQWQRDKQYDRDTISNMVYSMSFYVYENTERDRNTGEYIPKAWYVTWDVRLNSPDQQHRDKIAGQYQKRYTDKAAALKYIEGRKKAYAHLFTEISPPIPQEYADSFRINGVLLPGYRIENQEPRTTEKTALELLNELLGKDLFSDLGRSSILGSLAAAKYAQVKESESASKKKREPEI